MRSLVVVPVSILRNCFPRTIYIEVKLIIDRSVCSFNLSVPRSRSLRNESVCESLLNKRCVKQSSELSSVVCLNSQNGKRKELLCSCECLHGRRSIFAWKRCGVLHVCDRIHEPKLVVPVPVSTWNILHIQLNVFPRIRCIKRILERCVPNLFLLLLSNESFLLHEL